MRFKRKKRGFLTNLSLITITYLGQTPPKFLIAHTLFYFTKPHDLILDPMAGGGVVPDVCLLFERKCQAFDLSPGGDKRPEIEHHHWNPQNRTWPVTKKPDLIFFDPPYYTKKQKEYEKKATTTTPSISSYTKRNYERFFKDFFTLAHENSKPATTLAFLNAGETYSRHHRKNTAYSQKEIKNPYP